MTWQFVLAGALGIRLVGVPAATLVVEIGIAVGVLALVAWVAMQLRQRRLTVQDAA